jgi:hypothetical protein
VKQGQPWPIVPSRVYSPLHHQLPDYKRRELVVGPGSVHRRGSYIEFSPNINDYNSEPQDSSMGPPQTLPVQL